MSSPAQLESGSPPAQPSSVWKLVIVASITIGINFVSAIQMFWLPPVYHILGVPDRWISLVWIGGLVCSYVLQPAITYYRSRCRRPHLFIIAGAVSVAIALLTIGFAVDIGYALGDNLSKETLPYAIVIFGIGFWMLDASIMLIKAPCQAFLNDLASRDERKIRLASTFSSSFMAVGNVLGYFSAFVHYEDTFPFTETKACHYFCTLAKGISFLAMLPLLSLTTVALSCVQDNPALLEEESREREEEDDRCPVVTCFREMIGAIKGLNKAMLSLMAVEALSWLAWYGFFWYISDWMGREVYGWEPVQPGIYALYNNGFGYGARGLIITWVVMGVMSLAVEPIGRALGGAKNLWGVGNFILAGGLTMTVYISKLAKDERLQHHDLFDIHPPSIVIQILAHCVFGVLGISLAITVSVAPALASIYSNESGAGKGLPFNLAIGIPKIIMALLSVRWNNVFGGGNLPTFIVGAVAAAVSGIMAIFLLPSTTQSDVIRNG